MASQLTPAKRAKLRANSISLWRALQELTRVERILDAGNTVPEKVVNAALAKAKKVLSKVEQNPQLETADNV